MHKDKFSDRRRAKQVLFKSASIVEWSSDAIIGKTLEGIILSWNPGAEKIYGYSVDEVKGRSVSILVPSDDDQQPEILSKIKRGETIRYETVHTRKDGRQIDVSLTISPIKDAVGKIIGAAMIARE